MFFGLQRNIYFFNFKKKCFKRAVLICYSAIWNGKFLRRFTVYEKGCALKSKTHPFDGLDK